MSVFDFDTMKCPYPAYRTLRDTDPVHFEPLLNVNVITRYDLVREAIKDTHTFSSRFDGFLNAGQQMMFNAASDDVKAQLTRIAAELIPLPPTMLTLDEPEHTQFRSLVSQLFTVSQIKKSQAAVSATIDAAIAAFIDGPSAMEFMRAFAFPVPLQIISERLGIPNADRAFFYEAANAAAAALRLSPQTPEAMVSARAAHTRPAAPARTAHRGASRGAARRHDHDPRNPPARRSEPAADSRRVSVDPEPVPRRGARDDDERVRLGHAAADPGIRSSKTVSAAMPARSRRSSKRRCASNHPFRGCRAW